MIEILKETFYAMQTSQFSTWLNEHIINNETLWCKLGLIVFIGYYIFSVTEGKDRLYEDGLLFHIMPAFIVSAILIGIIYFAIYFHAATIILIFFAIIAKIIKILNDLTKELFKPQEE